MIILASASPRRKELLSLICDNFKIIPADIDESLDGNVSLYDIPEYLAIQKAAAVHRNHPDDIVIGCDTGVFVDNPMIGKPKSEKAAVEILKLLSGKTHRVITGCAILSKDEPISSSTLTEVEFYKLSEQEQLEYVKTGEPMDKAGAYGIQGKGGVLIKKIKGDYFNVVGLPVAELKRKLYD